MHIKVSTRGRETTNLPGWRVRRPQCHSPQLGPPPLPLRTALPFRPEPPLRPPAPQPPKPHGRAVQPAVVPADVRLAFSELDKNGSGTLELAEIHTGLHRLGVSVDMPSYMARSMSQKAIVLSPTSAWSWLSAYAMLFSL